MKLQMVIPSLSGGGAERIATNLVNELCREGHKINIVLLEDRKPFYILDENIKIRYPDYKVNRNNRLVSLLHIAINILFRLPAYIKLETERFDPDTVISFLPYADIAVYLSGIYKKGYKLIFSERNDPTRRSIFMQYLLKHIYAKGDALICQSEKVTRFYDEIDENKRFIIPNPVVRGNMPDTVAEGNPSRIVAVGRLDTQKNFEMLIDSFSLVYEKLPPETTLTIYGEGPLRNTLQEQIEAKGMRNSVLLPGASKNLFNEIKDASLFVMSSNYEGFPNALLEAMAVGLPVISTDFWTGTAGELIGVNNGRVVRVGDTEGLSDAIVEIMHNESLRRGMRKENRKLLDKYASEKIIHKWCEIILS